MNSEQTIDIIIQKNLSGERLKQFNRLYYGKYYHNQINLKNENITKSKSLNLDLQSYQIRDHLKNNEKLVKIGLIQHSIELGTDKMVQAQKEAIYNKVEKIIQIAGDETVNILCLQEAWNMPFGLCTQELKPWCEFAEEIDGPSTCFLKQFAKKYNMVIISPILERDSDGSFWNAAVVISNTGNIIGKHRKNHLPIIGSSNEKTYYKEGTSGHPVFQTIYGKIAVNICYGRHHPLNWLMFAINGAEIVFNPCATVSSFGELLWPIEARCAAFDNYYFTCCINRVGIETFKCQTGLKELQREYFGSSFITAPNGVRTPGLSRIEDGLLIALIDLNMVDHIRNESEFYNIPKQIEMYLSALKSGLNDK